ncbi:hypothetical protein CRENBAI_014414 [Crenichthys baileyi]|uniref:Uncharacterized protein n=1 Tax=Crenichthys baileyi TaxID=28760 RepID=A0AAV9RKC7_9TELE
MTQHIVVDKYKDDLDREEYLQLCLLSAFWGPPPHHTRMFPPPKDLADKLQTSARDHWVQRQIDEARRYLPNDLEVLPSPLLLEQKERVAAQRQGS